MTIEEARHLIRNAPSYAKLFKAAVSYYKTMEPTETELVAKRVEYEREPECLLRVHSQVWNVKSNRCKTLRDLAFDIYKETGLPRRFSTMHRSDGIDMDKLASMDYVEPMHKENQNS